MSHYEDEANAWSISVKTVGAELLESGESVSREKDFVVEVSPEDHVRALYEKIENETGLKACQQRLIYRGRLIGGIEESKKDSLVEEARRESKIKDIVGLDDGHTIHLVRRRESQDTQRTPVNSANDSTGSFGTENGLGNTSSLLTSLLNNMGDSSNVGEPGESMSGTRLLRPSRLTTRRRAHYRLSSEDIEVPDPGSMEPVRQGLMTLHSLLPPARLNFSHQEEERTPLDINRQWHIGQWIDCRDTVNQWLESTIVEIVRPHEILPARQSSTPSRQRLPTVHPVTDAIVGPHDLEGRRRLLLEPCSDDDEENEGGELAGFRQRDTNENVKLLLVHYNGWPHRWDEWIRSDSERIRPFRVRTRHPSSSPTALPTPQVHYGESPPTYIRSTDESQDRQALLPELGHVLDAVNSLYQTAATSHVRAQGVPPPRENGTEADLPWSPTVAAAYREAPTARKSDENEDVAEAEDDDTLPRRHLEALAPLLDRLGRTLVDAAPHVASLASSMARQEERQNSGSSALSSIEENTSTLGGLLSLLNRDRRRTSTSNEQHRSASEEDAGSLPTAAAMIRRRLSTSSSNVAVSSANSVASNELPVTPVRSPVWIDPDFVDFATGVVNTTRGEVRGGPRSRRGQSDELAGFLGAYLAAASLASITGGGVDDADNDNVSGLVRLLRDRGNGSGGIDIHIHAVVTSPNGNEGGGGGGTVNVLSPPGGVSPATDTDVTVGNDNLASTFGNFFSHRERRTTTPNADPVISPTLQRDEDDMGIFAELYSETPDPLDPTSVNPVSSTPVVSSLGDSIVPGWEGASTSVSMAIEGSSSGVSPYRPGHAQNTRRRGNLLSRLFRRNNSRR